MFNIKQRKKEMLMRDNFTKEEIELITKVGPVHKNNMSLEDYISECHNFIKVNK